MNTIPENSRLERLTVPAALRADHRLRVLHFIPSLENNESTEQCLEILKHLNEDRFEPRLAVIRREGPLQGKLPEQLIDIPEFPFSGFRSMGTVHQLNRLRRFIKLHRISILHGHDLYTGLLGSLAARWAGIPAVVSQHHLPFHQSSKHEIGLRWLHKLSHRVLVNTETTHKQLLLENSGVRGKFVLIRNGFEVIRNVQEWHQRQRVRLLKELQLADDAIIIGSVGNFVLAKGHLTLIEAARQILAKEDRVHFVLVGKGPLQDSLAAQVREMEMGTRVHLVDTDSVPDSQQLAAGFDLFVSASIDEGMPLDVIEAMALAVPVVATAVGATPELVKNFDTGFLVQPSNPDALAERILYALARREETDMIKMRGYRFILNQFPVRKMIDSVEALYENLLKN